MRFARKRDANERAIIRALEARGAHVAQLDGAGVPDLVVSVQGTLTLVEVKDVKEGKTMVQKGKHDNAEYRELTPAQVTWWQKWRGKPAIVVHSPEEAVRLLVDAGVQLG